MVGTAALPHILMRYYTTPSVREARRSVFWSLFFIFLLYVTAPAYAVFAKWEVYSNLVGTDIASLPLGGVLGQGRAGEDRGHQRRRHPATGRADHQQRRDPAAGARDRRPALCGVGPGGGGGWRRPCPPPTACC
jgi:hypothetical protein